MNVTSYKIKTILSYEPKIGTNERYNYLYKIENLKNNKYYYGVHSTKKLNDNYLGSGKILHEAYKKYGVENFIKTILEFFDNEELMFKKENEIVNEDVVSDKESYNIRLGGTGNVVGQAILKDDSNNFFIISTNDPNYKNYHGTTYGYKAIYKDNKLKTVSKDKLQMYLDEGWKLGTILKQTLNKIKINKDNKNLFVEKDELQHYLDDGWSIGQYISDEVRAKNSNYNKNHISVRDKNGNALKISKEKFTEEFVGVTKNYKWITNGIENKSLPKEQCEKFLIENPLWYYGCTIKKNQNNKTNTNMVFIYKDDIQKMVLKGELQKYLDDGWIKGRKENYTKGRIAITKNEECKFINKDELQQYLDDGWIKKGKTKNLGKKYIHKDNLQKMVYPDELQKYLDDGWILGNKPTIKGWIFINKDGQNKVIDPSKLNEWILKGWTRGKIKNANN